MTTSDSTGRAAGVSLDEGVEYLLDRDTARDGTRIHPGGPESTDRFILDGRQWLRWIYADGCTDEVALDGPVIEVPIDGPVIEVPAAADPARRKVLEMLGDTPGSTDDDPMEQAWERAWAGQPITVSGAALAASPDWADYQPSTVPQEQIDRRVTLAICHLAEALGTTPEAILDITLTPTALTAVVKEPTAADGSDAISAGELATTRQGSTYTFRPETARRVR